MKSTIPLTGLRAGGKTSITEPCVSRNHTELVLRYFDVSVETKDTTIVIRPITEFHSSVMEVLGGISSVAYFIAAGLMVSDSGILTRNVGVNPTRDGILRVCQDMGTDVTFLNQSTVSMEPITDLLVHHGALHETEIGGAVIPAPIDELSMIVAMTCLAEGDTVIRDVAELKVKESNYLRVMINCLTAMGVGVEERPDGMVIHGDKPLHEAVIDSQLDHRTAMTLAIASLYADGGTEILGTDCVNVSYPGFYEDLKKLI